MLSLRDRIVRANPLDIGLLSNSLSNNRTALARDPGIQARARGEKIVRVVVYGAIRIIYKNNKLRKRGRE